MSVGVGMPDPGSSGRIDRLCLKINPLLPMQVEATDYPASLDMATFAQGGVKGQVNGAWHCVCRFLGRSHFLNNDMMNASPLNQIGQK